ncbi:MAG: hypothetical protein EAZ76_06850 [Nostocales cyanobacterium]|nr:MAG: hypothetical protein EAZ76_06850 [Nostocales cyanobacterium]
MLFGFFGFFGFTLCFQHNWFSYQLSVIGHWALGIGHWALGIGHWLFILPLSPCHLSTVTCPLSTVH